MSSNSKTKTKSSPERNLQTIYQQLVKNGKTSRIKHILVVPEFSESFEDSAYDHPKHPAVTRADNSEILAAFNTAAKAFTHIKLFKLHLESAELKFNDGIWKGFCSVKPISVKEMPDGSLNNSDISRCLSMNAHRLQMNFFSLAGIAAEMILQNKDSVKDYYEHEDFQKAVREERKSMFIPLVEQKTDQHLAAIKITELQLSWVKLKISTDVPWAAITTLANELLANKKLSGLRCTRILDNAVTNAVWRLRREGKIGSSVNYNSLRTN